MHEYVAFMCVFASWVPVANRGQKMTNPLKLVIQAVVTHHVGARS